MRLGSYARGDAKNPGMAAALSVVPGLGQLYNGETRKAILFLDAAAINFVLLWMIFFTSPIVETLARFSGTFHLQVNRGLLVALQQTHLGSPLSLILFGMIISFIAYAVRDAYDCCVTVHRRRIYPECVLELPEATSGSYLLHFATICCCCILACFFIIPPQPKVQVTDIEFLEETHKQPVAMPTHFIADRPTSSGVHNPNRPVSTAKSAPSQPSPVNPPDPQPSANKSQLPQPPKPSPIESHTASPQPVPSLPVPGPSPPVVARKPLTAPSVMPVPSVKTSINSNPIAVPANPVRLPASRPAPAPKLLADHGSPPAAPLPADSGALSKEIAFLPAPPMMPSSSFKPASSAGPTPIHTSGSPAAATGSQNLAPAPSKFAGSQRASSAGPALAVSPARPGEPGAANPPLSSPGLPEAGGSPVDYSHYMEQLQRRIKRSWFPPKAPESERVVVTFKIRRDGELLGVRLEKSSGNAVSDQEALKAVRTAAPFAPLPAGADNFIDVQFTFDYNLFGGSSHGSFRSF